MFNILDVCSANFSIVSLKVSSAPLADISSSESTESSPHKVNLIHAPGVHKLLSEYVETLSLDISGRLCEFGLFVALQGNQK